MWATELQLILSCAGIVIGMANIWRFPKVLYENGGGASLNSSLPSRSYQFKEKSVQLPSKQAMGTA
ncbi:hypothetical protein HPB48_007490 [Haemaphysalis longicornis]|uniref:Uncharacterized protein n=1 Tax=Haemaphysalis longicornis TaxID=44386 RepID=A0A9J6GHN1_HAELO|nr:hypothetical protein HPB48_007490 [Haemaphysalis longicornis]